MEELLERAVKQRVFNFETIGVLAVIAVDGPIDKRILDPIVPQSVETLIHNGFVQENDTHYFVPGADYDDKKLRRHWEAFYAAYKGTRRGVNVEFEHFKKKYPKGKWREIVLILEENLHRQMDEKDAVKKAIEYQESINNRRHGMYVAPWKNMQTYINQKAWEETFPLPEQYRAKTQRDVSGETSNDAYGRYRKWASEQVISHGFGESLIGNMILSEDEFLGVVGGTLRAFKSYEQTVTIRELGVLIMEWQKEYLSSVTLRQVTSFVEYCSSQFIAKKNQ